MIFCPGMNIEESSLHADCLEVLDTKHDERASQKYCRVSYSAFLEQSVSNGFDLIWNKKLIFLLPRMTEINLQIILTAEKK